MMSKLDGEVGTISSMAWTTTIDGSVGTWTLYPSLDASHLLTAVNCYLAHMLVLLALHSLCE